MAKVPAAPWISTPPAKLAWLLATVEFTKLEVPMP
jgi:hypothetical protein